MITHDELNSIYPIENLLNSLGLKRIKDRGDYYQFSSPFHEDKKPSMVLYKKNLFCIDFSRDYRASLFKLVKDISGTDIFSYANIDKSQFKDFAFNQSLKEKPRERFASRKKSINISGKLVSVYSDEEASLYCQKRNLFPDFIKAFDVSFSKDSLINGTKFYRRLCVPVKENMKIVSLEGRDVSGKSKTKVLYPKGGSVSTLFNIDNLDKKKPLVVVEGIMDIPKIWKFFTKNVTTTFGIQITNEQKTLLSSFDHIILFPDGDDGGREMIRIFDSFYHKEYKIAFIDKKDPGDAFIKEIETALNDSVKSINWFLDESNLFPEKEKNFFIF